jgi:hypothetical protein
MIITLVFEKNANLFAEKWEKTQKIVIITSTPGENPLFLIGKYVKVSMYVHIIFISKIRMI